MQAGAGTDSGSLELGRGWSTIELRPVRWWQGGGGERSGPRPGALAPRGVGAILDTAFDVLTARPLTCAGLAAALWVPALALGRVSLRARGPLEAVSALSGLAGQFVVQSLAVALVTVIVYGHMQGRRVGGWHSSRIALRRAPALLATTFISSVTVAAGGLCCFVPGVVLSWLWMVAPAALVLENAGPLQALTRSARLVQGGFLRWAGTMLAQLALTLPLTGVAAVLGDPGTRAWLEARAGLGSTAFDVIDVGLSATLMGIATALGAVVLTVFYIDCRVRAEGFDLVMRLERLAQRGTPREPAGRTR